MYGINFIFHKKRYFIDFCFFDSNISIANSSQKCSNLFVSIPNEEYMCGKMKKLKCCEKVNDTGSVHMTACSCFGVLLCIIFANLIGIDVQSSVINIQNPHQMSSFGCTKLRSLFVHCCMCIETMLVFLFHTVA